MITMKIKKQTIEEIGQKKRKEFDKECNKYGHIDECPYQKSLCRREKECNKKTAELFVKLVFRKI